MEKKFFVEFLVTIVSFLFILLSIIFASQDISYYQAFDNILSKKTGLTLLQVDHILHASYVPLNLILCTFIILLYCLKYFKTLRYSPYYMFFQSLIWFSLFIVLLFPVDALNNVHNNNQYTFDGVSILGALALLLALVSSVGLFLAGIVTIVKNLNFSRKEIPIFWSKATPQNKSITLSLVGLICGNIMVLSGLFLIPFSTYYNVDFGFLFLPTIFLSCLVIIGYELIYLYLLRLYLYSEINWIGETNRFQNTFITIIVIAYQFVQLIPVLTTSHYILLINSIDLTHLLVITLFVVGEITCLVSVLNLVLLHSKNITIGFQTHPST